MKSQKAIHMINLGTEGVVGRPEDDRLSQAFFGEFWWMEKWTFWLSINNQNEKLNQPEEVSIDRAFNAQVSILKCLDESTH